MVEMNANDDEKLENDVEKIVLELVVALIGKIF